MYKPMHALERYKEMKFGYTIIYVKSVADSLAFYEKAFGFKTKFLHESGEYGELSTGATALAFASFQLAEANLGEDYLPLSAETKPPGIELAFVTEDVHEAYQKAISCGALPIRGPVEKPWGQVVAHLRSIEGTVIELCSPMGT